MKTKQEQKAEALKAYKAIIDPALKIYNGIAEPATEAYDAKLREIDGQDIKIIDGKRYKLIEE